MYEFETIAACHKMLRDMFKVKTGETVAITYDTVSCEKVAEATAQAAVALGAKPLLLKMSAPIHKSKMADYERPYNALYGALANADIWIEYNCNKTCLCYSQLFEDVVRDNTNIRYLCNCNCNEGTMVRMIGRQDMLITHDLSLVRNISTRVAIMYLGRICEIAETAEFYNKPIHPYTQMLLSAIPVISEEEEKLKPKKIISQGEIPSPVNVPTGCRFNTRCKYCIDKCRQEEPQMEEILPGHFVRCHRCHEMLDGVITAEIQEDEF